ncbi:uncharacterized protein F5147DRAFT_713141 [Suillus discolor]|uniref:Uncharacterized protein n=1 Tax=Suillus discolor TaxID=1912936 RepID=A0A9P7F0Y5_9AGAM|nr:uncharacterized protein F5147DRAFT_713141 [Suillus discolor]KAG2098984.1 hypothetical protein F5147DRAFT_713141 [Suillus discolor]
MDRFRSGSVQAEMRAMLRIYMLWHSAHLLLTLMILPTGIVLANGKGTCGFHRIQGRGQVASILALPSFLVHHDGREGGRWMVRFAGISVQSRKSMEHFPRHHTRGCGWCDEVGLVQYWLLIDANGPHSRGAGIGLARDRLQGISDQARTVRISSLEQVE